jgi:hypothetical protein
VERAIRAAEGYPLEIVPGIELLQWTAMTNSHPRVFYQLHQSGVLDRIAFFMEKRLERARK